LVRWLKIGALAENWCVGWKLVRWLEIWCVGWKFGALAENWCVAFFVLPVSYE